MKELVEGDEVVATCPEIRQHLSECGHRLAAIATAIVKEHDRSRSGVSQNRGHDPADPRAGPVTGIDRPGDALKTDRGRKTRDAGINRPVRRPKPEGAPAGGCLDLVLCFLQLKQDAGIRQREQIWMRERMIADFIAGSDFGPSDGPKLGHLPADHEKRCLGAIPAQQREDSGRVRRRTIVEGEGDCRPDGRTRAQHGRCHTWGGSGIGWPVERRQGEKCRQQDGLETAKRRQLGS